MNEINIIKDDAFLSMKQLKASGLLFQDIDNGKITGRYYSVNNKKLINFSSCSYLGLETRDELKEGSVRATEMYGTQISMSRGGLSAPLYKEIDSLTQKIFPGYHILTQTVTLGHFSILPLLIDKDDAIILDSYVHNSVRMASQYCVANGTLTLVSRHNDISHVEYLIKRLKKEGKKRIWYCCDGVYSMLGNFCDINGINALLEKEENLYVYVDDAHGTGWYGKNGRGYVLENGGLHERMIVAASFAKSIGACGGMLILPNEELAEYVRMRGQTMIFSGGVPPPVLGAIHASLKFHLSDEFETLQNRLFELINYFRNKCNELELNIITKDITPIQLLRIGSTERTIQVLNHVFNSGYHCLPSVYPAVRVGDEGLRMAITSHINENDIDMLLFSLKNIVNR